MPFSALIVDDEPLAREGLRMNHKKLRRLYRATS